MGDKVEYSSEWEMVETEPEAVRPRIYERFNLHHRLQHFFMAFPFIMLILTGWPLRFPELAVSKMSIAMVGGVESMGIIHRVFGVMLVGVSIYHVVYLVAMFFKGHRSMEMIPTLTDAKEAWGDIMYFLGIRKDRPRFGRYNWIEKSEYYAVIWGTVIMIITGVIIWFPQWAALYLPNWAVSASVIVHGYEALLAGLAIFLWHFYWVHLHPSVYPMSMVWLTGKLSESEMEHHHPRELEKLKAQEPDGAADGPESKVEVTGTGDPDSKDGTAPGGEEEA